MIRVLVVDDHPAVLTGLLVALRCEPGIVPVAGVSSAEEAMNEARRGDVDVALLDYHLPDEDGLGVRRDRPVGGGPMLQSLALAAESRRYLFSSSTFTSRAPRIASPPAFLPVANLRSPRGRDLVVGIVVASLCFALTSRRQRRQRIESVKVDDPPPA